MSSPFDRQRAERLALAIKERKKRDARAEQSKPRGGLLAFVKHFWRVLEPVDEFIDGWPLHALCAHLEAITRGDDVTINGIDRKLNRFLANVPPGFMKSLLVNVFWPAWEWGPQELPHLRTVAFSYSPELTQRDNAKFRDLITSQEYRELWGHVFSVVGDGKIRVTNDKTGFKFATSFGGVGTGERGHRVILDDPHKIKGTQESDEARRSITQWVEEGMQNRLNDLRRDAIVIIMQRVHEDDSSGAVMKALGDEYCHLIIPMEFEAGRHFSHYKGWNGGNDPRSRDGDLAWPDRYDRTTLASFKRNPYLWAGQYQQRPSPRGGGMFKDNWWQVHEVRRSDKGGMIFVPEVQPLFVLASLDTAFSESEQNDLSALTVWIVYDDPVTKYRRIMLGDAWAKRLPELSGEQVERLPGETEGAWRRRAQPKWGLVEWIDFSCRRRRVQQLIVENKNRAPDVVRTLKKHFADRDYGVQAVDIRGDKWARAAAQVDLFTDNMIHAPAEITDAGDVRFLDWADEAIREISTFPRGAHDDYVDSMTLALKFLRDRGWAVRKEEFRSEQREAMTHRGQQKQAIYPV